MIDKLFPMLLHNEIRSIHILETEFINSITYNANDKKIFPFSRRKRESDVPAFQTCCHRHHYSRNYSGDYI